MGNDDQLFARNVRKQRLNELLIERDGRFIELLFFP